MKKNKFSIAHKDGALAELVSKTDHKILATWAIDCVERVLGYFEEEYPEDRHLLELRSTYETNDKAQ